METNKQKAEEIADRCCDQCGTDYYNCENAALEMAEWKDKQFIGLLDTLNHNAFPSHENYVEFIKSLLSI